MYFPASDGVARHNDDVHPHAFDSRLPLAPRPCHCFPAPMDLFDRLKPPVTPAAAPPPGEAFARVAGVRLKAESW